MLVSHPHAQNVQTGMIHPPLAKYKEETHLNYINLAQQFTKRMTTLFRSCTC